MYIRFILKELLPQVNKINLNIKNHQKYFSKNKKQIDPVTKYDQLIEKKIRYLISKKFPDHSIFGEEERPLIKKNSDYKWIIDPIDGTKALILGQPTWSNLIGLYYKNKPILSFANFPILSKYYYADESGSYLFIKNKLKKIKSSNIKKIETSKMITNSIHTFKNNKLFNFFKNYKYFFKITGSDAYNFCLLCEGKIDILFECGLKQVDILPLKKIIEKSGSVISNWKGASDTSNGDIIVSSNKNLHYEFLKYLKSHKIK